MDEQMETQMEHEMETAVYVGVAWGLRLLHF